MQRRDTRAIQKLQHPVEVQTDLVDAMAVIGKTEPTSTRQKFLSDISPYSPVKERERGIRSNLTWQISALGYGSDIPFLNAAPFNSKIPP